MKTLKLHITILFIFISLISFNNDLKAEGKIDSLINVFNLKRADKAYESMAYVKAIEIYNKLLEKNFTNIDIYRNLANSYLKLGEAEESIIFYEKIINTSEYKPEDIYNYAQALKYNGDYIQAEKWLEKYASLNVEDSRAKRQVNTLDKVEKIKSTPKFEIEEVSFNSKYSDFGPFLYDNKLYFASERRVDAVVNYEYAWKEAPYLDIYEVNLNGLVTNPQFLKDKINSKYHDGPLCFSKDGREMFFTRNNSIFRIISKKGEDNVNNLKIYYVKNNNGVLTDPVEMPFNSENYSCGHPSLSADGNKLYFTSDMPGGYGGSDIYYVERTDSGWTTPQNMGPEINTEGDEMFPFIHESGALYFASNGQLGLGGLDIFKAKLENGRYVVENIGYPINSEKDDFALIIDEEQKNGYFSSNREGGKGDDDIYKFHALKIDLNLIGKVYDIETKEHIEEASIVLMNSKGEKLGLISSSEEFDYKAEVDPNETYTINVDKDEYDLYTTSFVPSELEQKDYTIQYNVFLKKAPFWGIFGKIYFKETLEEIPGVSIKIIDLVANDTTEYFSNENGDFRIKLDKNTDYNLFFSKEGIFSKRANYSTVATEPGWVNADKIVELAFEKVELNKKIEIPNIYYDLGKWNIREDAAIELDKVVQFLTDNPQIKIELGSHTDARGSAKSNQWLSQQRAQSAVDYIVNKGISKDRITAKGYGESQLKNRCADGVKCSEAEHQENRRTEIRITGI